MAVGGDDGDVRLLNPASLTVRNTIASGAGPITRIVALRGKPALVAGHEDGSVSVLDLVQHRPGRRWPAHTGTVDRLLAVGDQGGFASAGRDGKVPWWANPAAEPVELLRSKFWISSLAAGPDGAILAGDRSGMLHGRRPGSDWRIERQLLGTQANRRQLTALCLDADNHTLWVGSNDHCVRRIDLFDATIEKVWPSRNGTVRQLASKEQTPITWLTERA